MQVDTRAIRAGTLAALIGCAFSSVHAAVITPVSANLIAGTQAFPSLPESNIGFVIDGVVNATQWYGVLPSSGTIRLNLGGTFDLDSVTIWNNAEGIGNDSEGIKSFGLDFFDATLAAGAEMSNLLVNSHFLHTLITGSVMAMLWAIVPADGRAWEYQSRFPPTLRCAGDLIAEGDSVARLVDRCGEPGSISRTEAYSTEEPVYSYRQDGVKAQTGTTKVTHSAHETWLYNVGPGHFTYEIGVNDGGYITSIKEGQYGGLR